MKGRSVVENLVKKAITKYPDHNGWVGINKRRSKEMALRADVKLGASRSKRDQDPAFYENLRRKLVGNEAVAEMTSLEKSGHQQVPVPSLTKQAFDAFGEAPDLEEDSAIIFGDGMFVETRR